MVKSIFYSTEITNWGTCIAPPPTRRPRAHHRVLVPVNRKKQKCFQITTKQVRQWQQFQLQILHSNTPVMLSKYWICEQASTTYENNTRFFLPLTQIFRQAHLSAVRQWLVPQTVQIASALRSASWQRHQAL